MHEKLETTARANGRMLLVETGSSPPPTVDLARIVGQNLRRLRTRRGMSLQRLSRASGVSRAMLSQVELGRSSPTVNVIWKISQALAVSVSALLTDADEPRLTVLRAASAKSLTSRDGKVSSRALRPVDETGAVEFRELRLAPGSTETAEPCPPRTQENLVVADGMLRVVIGGKSHQLEVGDAIVFDADAPHSYCNEGPDELRLYVVLTSQNFESWRGSSHT